MGRRSNWDFYFRQLEGNRGGEGGEKILKRKGLAEVN
jgi:hypothetical protein